MDRSKKLPPSFESLSFPVQSQDSTQAEQLPEVRRIWDTEEQAWYYSVVDFINLLIALLSGSFHRAVWTPRGVVAILYLVTCGSWIGFTAYIWLLEHVPTPKVATYAYVNPVVAVYLGWLLLSEKVDAFMLAGTVVIIAAVALVNLSKLRRLKSGVEAGQPGLSAVEPAGD